jgi:hypothetical protein
MTDDALERVLRLVSEGRLTADEAGPILDALETGAGTADARTTRTSGTAARPAADAAPKGSPAGGSARAIRIEVSDQGRKVVNLRVPLALGRAALDRIPGLSETVTDRVREALASGITGAIVDIDDDGDGVRIVIE